MNRLRFGLAIGAVCAMTLGATPATQAADSFRFSFDTGGVAFAYSDGYWDRQHNWHKWHNSREAREYRNRYAVNWHAEKHTRVKNQGWRDEDHDHVPNAMDRDRDGDGVKNNRDRAPDNARRR